MPNKYRNDMAVIEIEVIYDFVCAWCYIAKRTLDRAISLYQKTVPGGRSDIFSVKYRPYYLNYNPHPHSVDKSELIDVRLRDMAPEQHIALFNRMDQIGRSMGILFKAGGKIGSTRDAHRVVYYCQMNEIEKDADAVTTNALVEKIFETYHEREMDISDPDVLRDLAVDAGVSREEMDGWLDASPAVVDEEARKNKDEVKSGVPVFIIQGEHRIDGPGDISEFLEIFSKAREWDAGQ